LWDNCILLPNGQYHLYLGLVFLIQKRRNILTENSNPIYAMLMNSFRKHFFLLFINYHISLNSNRLF
ncbi:hypothetical protein, partial [Bacillus aquiflavi]|uniref:hypothetical protein n=1 Tax=Bacillus aquiflavi TaxID=2672567 RepID=UPI001C555D57